MRSVDEQAQYQWTLEEVQSEEVSKKQLIEYLLEHMPEPLKLKHKINKSAVKKLSKEKAVVAYQVLGLHAPVMTRWLC